MCWRVPNDYEHQFTTWSWDDKDAFSYPHAARLAAGIAYDQDVSCRDRKISGVVCNGALGRVFRTLGAVQDIICACATPLICLGGAALCAAESCVAGASITTATCYPKDSDQRKRAVQGGLKHCGEGLDACACVSKLTAICIGRAAMDVVTVPANLLCHEAMNGCQPQADLWCNQAAVSASSMSMCTDALTAKADAMYKPPVQVVA